MNELFVLLEAVAGLGWAYLCAMTTLAAGLLIFDRRATRAEDAARPDQRDAA